MNSDWIAQTTTSQEWSVHQFWLTQIGRSFLVFHYFPEHGHGNYYDLEQPLSHGVAALLLAMGIFIALYQIRQRRFQLLLAWMLLTAIFGGVLLRNPPAVQRYLTLAPVVTILMAVAIDWLFEKANNYWPRRQTFLRIVEVVLVCYLVATSIWHYFGDYLYRETYGTIVSQGATMLGHYLRQQPLGTEVWYVGNRTFGYRLSHVQRYMAPHTTHHHLLSVDSLATVAPYEFAGGPNHEWQ
ncbi:hypothetical protein KFU94_61380 [Chloroflexi bacterium TSY]|nr:hypothetical protein [Chloroflexi bacterium TSY]